MKMRFHVEPCSAPPCDGSAIFVVPSVSAGSHAQITTPVRGRFLSAKINQHEQLNTNVVMNTYVIRSNPLEQLAPRLGLEKQTPMHPPRFGQKPLCLATALIMMTTLAGSAHHGPRASLLVSGLEGGSAGSTVGPDGALYVTEGNAGKIYRVDPETGHTTTFASGLPPGIVGIGGPVDVAFIDKTAY